MVCANATRECLWSAHAHYSRIPLSLPAWRSVMSRSDTERDIIETLGQVPDFFKDMPDDTLAREWPEWKSFQLADSALTAREKHLIGLGVAAATYCPYCTYFHHNAAQMMGASDAQIEEAAPWGSRMPFLGVTYTRTFIGSPAR